MATATADAITGVAAALRALGNGDASTSMGAIENLAVHVEKHSDRIGEALDNVAEWLGQIALAIDNIASVLEQKARG